MYTFFVVPPLCRCCRATGHANGSDGLSVYIYIYLYTMKKTLFRARVSKISKLWAPNVYDRLGGYNLSAEPIMSWPREAIHAAVQVHKWGRASSLWNTLQRKLDYRIRTSRTPKPTVKWHSFLPVPFRSVALVFTLKSPRGIPPTFSDVQNNMRAVGCALENSSKANFLAILVVRIISSRRRAYDI